MFSKPAITQRDSPITVGVQAYENTKAIRSRERRVILIASAMHKAQRAQDVREIASLIEQLPGGPGTALLAQPLLELIIQTISPDFMHKLMRSGAVSLDASGNYIKGSYEEIEAAKSRAAETAPAPTPATEPQPQLSEDDLS